MFVGHALAAFALVSLVARWHGVAIERALQVGVVAALFATAPDLDILYGPVGLFGGVSGAADAAAAFWETGNLVHRGPTHSLVVGVVAATAFAAVRHTDPVRRGVGLVALAGVVATVALVSGLLGALVTTAFLVGGLLVVRLASRWDLSATTVGLAALAGLVTHPFGDLFTGTPPDLLYPFDVVLLADRVTLHPDPTLNLLAAFGVELAVVWVALCVALSITGRSVRSHVDRRAALGLAYGGAAVALPAPTLDAASPFVFSVLALGAVGFPRRRIRSLDVARATCTGLAAVTCAALAYGVAYMVV